MTFLCGYCPNAYQQFSELVEHYEKQHSRPLLAILTPKRWLNWLHR